MNRSSKQFRSLLLSAMCTCALVSTAAAQPMMPAGSADGGPKSIAPNEVINKIGVDQKLEAQINPDLKFTNEKGETVRIGDYFGKRPLILSLVYYECPGLCTMTLNGIVTSLRPLSFTPGKEYDVLTISFDPRETSKLAAAKKQRYIKDFLRPNAAGNHDPATTESGWHFLTGDEANVAELCKTVGFRYAFDEKTKQYAHASAIMVLTPKGKVSRYFYGLEYSTKDIRLGLVEATDEKIGTLTDAMTLYCYMYDPASGKYSLAITRIVKIGGALTILSLGSFLAVMIRRERRFSANVAATEAATAASDTTGKKISAADTQEPR